MHSLAIVSHHFFYLAAVHRTDYRILQHSGEVGCYIAVHEGRTGTPDGIVPEPDAYGSPSQVGRIGDVVRVVIGVGGADSAGSASGKFRRQFIVMHFYLPWCYPMQLVVFDLPAPAPFGFPDSFVHRLADIVGIHYYQAVYVSGGPACGLGQRPCSTQETFLVGIENGNERYRGDIQPLPEQINPYKHVEQSVLEVLYYLHAVGGVDVGVDIPHPHTHPFQILVQFLGHTLGKRSHQSPFIPLGPLADFLQQVIHLILCRTDLDGRIQQSGGPYYLFHYKAARFFKFILGGSGTHVNLLSGNGLELLEAQGPVVGRGGKSEPVLDEHRLAGMVATVHRPYLRQGNVTFVDESDEILREIVNQAERALTGFPPVEVAGIILDSGAVAHLLNHLQVILYPLFQAFCLQRAIFAVKQVQLF